MSRRRNRERLAWGLAVVLAALAGVVFSSLTSPGTPSTQPPTRFAVHVPRTDQLQVNSNLSFSPDGKTLVYVAQHDGVRQLYRRSMDQLDVLPIPGTEGARNPFLSPDGGWVAFTDPVDRKLKKVSIEGGSALTLCDAQQGGGSWGSDGTIIFTPSYSDGLWRVSETGGTPEVLTTPDSSKGVLGHWWPQILPGGQEVLFTLFSTPIDQSRIAVYSLETGEQQVLIEGGIFGRYVPTGHLVYVQVGTLIAVPFNLARLEVTGPPVPVLEAVAVDSANSLAQFSFSAHGTLAYIPASVLDVESMLLWVDRTGSEEPVIEIPRRYSDPRLSPNGQRVAVTIEQENNRDVWVYELARGNRTRLTFGEANEFAPIWTPDGKRVIYISEQPLFDLYWRVADGSTPEEALLTSDYDNTPNSISPDGKVLAYTENNPDTGLDIWLLSLEGESEPKLFLGTPFNERYATFSPNGRWLAYQSNDSGQVEVYVRPYPGAEGKWAISTDGGREPVWSLDGRELFYRSGDQMMVVSVETEPSFIPGKPRLLFEGRFQLNPRGSLSYDVSPDGQRFLMIKAVEGSTAQINIVLNWFEELKRLVPTDN